MLLEKLFSNFIIVGGNMFQYEAYQTKAENCVTKAKEFSTNEHLVDFYQNAAKGFLQRSERLTLAEAMHTIEETEVLKADWQ